MNLILPFNRIDNRHRRRVGSKALTLAKLMQDGIAVPDGLCVTTTAYREYVRTTGLYTRIGLALDRLPLGEMRWEEIWDVSLSIRNLFLTTAIPDRLKAQLTPSLTDHFSDMAVVVRSSSPHEDRTGTSFAGLHDSEVNIRRIDAILDSIRRVWASLWSDGALLYRRELGLDLHNSAMAVIVQELVSGDRSGVAFSIGPDGADNAVVESVYGLNQGLVDGSVEPDRWILDRRNGAVLSHISAKREQAVRVVAEGTRQKPLGENEKATPPLDAEALATVFELIMRLEAIQGRPQDVEWTYRQGTLYLLQSRPVTTTRDAAASESPWSAQDKRPWYQSLKRSFDNLKRLHRRIEDELLPRMSAEADRMSAQDPKSLTDADLSDAIHRYGRIHRHWLDVYWREFIPFAHGARLFGQVYNDLIRPEDPYAFIALLGETEMTGLARNRDLQALAGMIRSNERLHRQLTDEETDPLPQAFTDRLEAFIDTYGDSTFKSVRLLQNHDGLIRLLLEMSDHPEPQNGGSKPDVHTLCTEFIARFPEDQQDFARDILEIGRSSYRLRDNDNLVLARIEAQLIKVVDEGKRRIHALEPIDLSTATPQQVARMLSDPTASHDIDAEQIAIDEPVQLHGRPDLNPRAVRLVEGDFAMRARQLIGHPAGQGLAQGDARVILSVDDLFRFKSGEILVCDAIDPNMTVVVPLAAAIVERRGGMLVHGAIIAREYGLPCVTGVADATAMIQTGDRLTVDGYLGIVTIGH